MKYRKYFRGPFSSPGNLSKVKVKIFRLFFGQTTSHELSRVKFRLTKHSRAEHSAVQSWRYSISYLLDEIWWGLFNDGRKLRSEVVCMRDDESCYTVNPYNIMVITLFLQIGSSYVLRFERPKDSWCRPSVLPWIITMMNGSRNASTRHILMSY